MSSCIEKWGPVALDRCPYLSWHCRCARRVSFRVEVDRPNVLESFTVPNQTVLLVTTSVL